MTDEFFEMIEECKNIDLDDFPEDDLSILFEDKPPEKLED